MFENLKFVGNCPCWAEDGHQISKGSVERFKSYRDLKNPRWPPACGRRLGFFCYLNIAGNSRYGSKVGHQISKGLV
jgi:hypothetical protein